MVGCVRTITSATTMIKYPPMLLLMMIFFSETMTVEREDEHGRAKAEFVDSSPFDFSLSSFVPQTDRARDISQPPTTTTLLPTLVNLYLSPSFTFRSLDAFHTSAFVLLSSSTTTSSSSRPSAPTSLLQPFHLQSSQQPSTHSDPFPFVRRYLRMGRTR